MWTYNKTPKYEKEDCFQSYRNAPVQRHGIKAVFADRENKYHGKALRITRLDALLADKSVEKLS